MKKVLLIVVVLLLLGGGGYYLYSKQMLKGSSTEQSGGVFGSIKDALSKSLSLQCAFTTEDGTQVAAWMKAGAVRVDSDAKDSKQSGSYIMKDNKMYFWQKGNKEGTMMEAVEPSVTPEKTQEVKPTGSAPSQENQSNNLLSMLEKFKDKCKPSVVSDSLFTPPSDVKFTDFSKMMPTIPTGQPSEQDVQKMMQQYQQNTSSGQ